MRGEVEFQKVSGSRNVADLWTKNVDQVVRNRHMQHIGFRYEEGRARRAVELNLREDQSMGEAVPCLRAWGFASWEDLVQA